MFWLLLAAFVVLGDGYLWSQWQTTVEARNADALSLENVNKWVPLCINDPGRGSGCHVVLSFSYLDAPGDKRFAILGLSENHATLTAPVERFTVTSWRVDGHPFAEALSTQGDGAVLSQQRSTALIEQMLAGKQLSVRFVASGTGRVIERSFALDDFPKAYARYRELQRGLATAKSV